MKELKEKLEVIKSLTGKQNIIINYAACYGGYQLCYLLDSGASAIFAYVCRAKSLFATWMV